MQVLPTQPGRCTQIPALLPPPCPGVIPIIQDQKNKIINKNVIVSL